MNILKKIVHTNKMKIDLLKKIIIGIIAGMVTGLFGSGGGMILVPAFTYILNLGEKEARATSVFCILPLVAVSSIFYFNSSYIELKTAILCAIRRYNSGDSLVQSFSKNYQIKF